MTYDGFFFLEPNSILCRTKTVYSLCGATVEFTAPGNRSSAMHPLEFITGGGTRGLKTKCYAVE